MVEFTPLIEKDELKKDIFDSCLSDKPHKVYMVYDDLMDELIFRLVPPEVPASVYHLEDNTALLVDLETLQIVGFQFFDFQEVHLKQNKELQEGWYDLNLAEELSNYVEFEYRPKRKSFFHGFQRNREKELLVDIYCKGSERMVEAFA